MFVFNWILWQKFHYALRDGQLTRSVVWPVVLLNTPRGAGHLRFLCTDLPLLLEDVAFHQEVCFVHVRAPPYFRCALRRHLNPTFGREWIGRGGPVKWPARSSELNRLDFGLWRHVKSLLYSQPIADLNYHSLSGDKSKTRIFFLKGYALLRDEELKVVLTCLRTTQSICYRDYRNITPYLGSQFCLESCWLELFCSLLWVLHAPAVCNGFC
jgi:hypothetical protein